MRRFVPLLAAITAPAAAAEQHYSLTDFDRIDVQGPYAVVLSTGIPTAGRAIGSRDAIERVTVEVVGRTLRVHANHSSWGGAYPGTSAGTVRIELSSRDLSTASVSGSGSLAIDKARGARLDLTLAGTGRLSVGRIDVDALTVTMVGSGQVTIAGKAKQAHATVQGNGDLKAEGLVAEDAVINSSTSGSVGLAAVRSARVVAGGIGDVTIGGTPACTVENKGGGAVRCGAGS